MSTVILVEPFNNLTAWTLGTTGTITAGGVVGTYLSIVGSGARGHLIASGDQSADLDVEFWFRTASPLNTSRVVLSIRDPSDNNYLTVQVLGTAPIGALRVFNGGTTGAVIGSSAAGTIVGGTWHKLRIVAHIAASPNGSVRVDVGGVTVINVAGVATNGGFGGVPDRLYLNGGGSGVINSYDELTLSSGPASAVKVWNGTAYVDAPVKVWNGTAYVAAVAVKTWNGTSFV